MRTLNEDPHEDPHETPHETPHEGLVIDFRQPSAEPMSAPVVDDDVFVDCTVCSGSKQRARRSAGSPVCKHSSCMRELARRTAAVQPAVACPMEVEPRVAQSRESCFKIKGVFGVSMCLELDATEKRLGREHEAEDLCYRVCSSMRSDCARSSTCDRRPKTTAKRAILIRNWYGTKKEGMRPLSVENKSGLLPRCLRKTP